MDKKKKVELEVINISNSQEQAGAYALVLREKNGIRQLPVIIGAAEAQAILITLKGYVPSRPLTHNLFASCLDVLGVRMMRVVIQKVDNGVFHSDIYLKADDTVIRMDARTSDAVTMALRMEAPIFVYEDILESEGLNTGLEGEPKRQEEQKERLESFQPDPDREREILEKALQSAIEKENYEHAAQIRDEINKRKRERE